MVLIVPAKGVLVISYSRFTAVSGISMAQSFRVAHELIGGSFDLVSLHRPMM